MKNNKKTKSIALLVSILSFLFLSIITVKASALTGQYDYYYDDDFAEALKYIFYDDTYYFHYGVRVTYDMESGPCIITGLRVKYKSLYPGSGPHETDITFMGDTQNVGWNINDLPYQSSQAWRTLNYAGPIYLIDDDPTLQMLGMGPQSNCIGIGMDDNSYNHSYEHNIFSGWILQADYEYLIDVEYELIDNLTLGSSKSGSITSVDFVDAYFVDLTENYQYNFTLNRTGGTGNLNMRLVSNAELTNNVLNSTSSTSDPENMLYTPISTDKYVLLIEPNENQTDIADYTISYTENKRPIADFIANSTILLINEPVGFTFTGEPGDLPATYTWDFGDGSPLSNLPNPSHQYTSEGNFTVSLIVNDTDGEEDTEIKTDYIQVEIDTNPTVDFIANATEIIAGDYVFFTYTGSGGNSPLNFEWNFGDGSPLSYLQNPTHQYTLANNYTVTLNVTDRDNDEVELDKIDYIEVNPNLLPYANFSTNITDIFSGDYIQFNFTGEPGDLPATYIWDFGDGSPISNLPNPSHQYINVGSFDVNLTVRDKNNDQNSLNKPGYINVEQDTTPNPNFTVNATQIYVGDNVSFTYTGIGGNSPLFFEWDFGDGSPLSYVQDPIHLYLSEGVFTINLTVRDKDGDQNSVVKIDLIVVSLKEETGNNENGGNDRDNNLISGFNPYLIIAILFVGISSVAYRFRRK